MTKDSSLAKVVEDTGGLPDIDIGEGDWDAYQKHLDDIRHISAVALKLYGGALGYKRACAMAYLGKRALVVDGANPVRKPPVLTTKLVDGGRAEAVPR